MGKFITIEKDLKTLENWSSTNNLFLNFEKTAVVLNSWNINTLSSKTKIILHDKTCDNKKKKNCKCKIINIVKNTKYLGLEMCSNMKWKEHILSVAKKIRKMIKELSNILKEKDLRLIYLVLVEPIISYGIIDWGGPFDNVLSRLQITQNSIIRVAMKKDPRFHTKTLYKNFHVLNIKHLYLKLTVIFLKKQHTITIIP